MPKPDADPHGGAEDFKTVEITTSKNKPGHEDGLDYH